jgi:hypothetical protein
MAAVIGASFVRPLIPSVPKNFRVIFKDRPEFSLAVTFTAINKGLIAP